MPEPNRRRRIWGWHSGQPPIGLLILVFAFLLAATIPATALDLDEMTVVTMAGDGSWGIATAASAVKPLPVQYAPVRRGLLHQRTAALNLQQREAAGSSPTCAATRSSS
jgi:hypothetical protein